MNVVIRNETALDQRAIRGVHQDAFGTEMEADLVDSLRSGGFVEVSLVAEVEGQVAGHILFSRLPITTANGTVDALSLAPMAVSPDHQRQGIGGRLVQTGLEACRHGGHRIVLVLGHPEFYRRFGFASDKAQMLESPFGGGDPWMALELVPGALIGVRGRVVYPPPFRIFE